MLHYIYDARDKGEKLTGSIIKAIALETSLKMNINNFGASNGWLFSFFKRNGLSMSDFNSKVVDHSNENESSTVIDANTENVQEISEIQYEIEYSEEPETHENEYSEVIEVNDWRSWCKFCGTMEQTEPLDGLDENTYEIFKSFFKFSLNYIQNSCAKCKLSFEESYKFLMKVKTVENMFIELEENETQHLVTNEIIAAIRQKYLADDVNNILDPEYITEEQENKEEKVIEETEEIVYETDYLEDEDYVVVEESIDEPSDANKTIPMNSSRTQDDDLYIYECHICNENFERMCFLTIHTQKAHNCLPQVACTCGKYLATWGSLMAHKRKHSTEPANFICDLCSSSFHTKTGLSIHIKFKHSKNTADVKYNCDICNIEFNDVLDWKNHNRSHKLVNDEKLQVECEFCMKKLSNKYSLRAHIATVHEKQKTILCHLCSKGFSNKSNLRSHLVSHTTEHVACHICNQVFKNRVSLQSHKKVHKPHSALKFACNHCGKRFHNRNHLERHMISHSSVKNFKCTYDGCDAAYKWEKDLKNHESVHQGLKKHQCEFCQRFFTDIANLRKHKLKHHHDELDIYELKYGKRRTMAQ